MTLVLQVAAVFPQESPSWLQSFHYVQSLAQGHFSRAEAWSFSGGPTLPSCSKLFSTDEGVITRHRFYLQLCSLFDPAAIVVLNWVSAVTGRSSANVILTVALSCEGYLHISCYLFTLCCTVFAYCTIYKRHNLVCLMVQGGPRFCLAAVNYLEHKEVGDWPCAPVEGLPQEICYADLQSVKVTKFIIVPNDWPCDTSKDLSLDCETQLL